MLKVVPFVLKFLSSLFLLVFVLDFSPLLVFLFWGIQVLQVCAFGTLWSYSNPTSLVLNLLESRAPMNRGFWLLRKPSLSLVSIQFLKFLYSFGGDLLVICSRDSCEGIPKVLWDLDFVWSRFTFWSKFIMLILHSPDSPAHFTGLSGRPNYLQMGWIFSMLFPMFSWA